MVIVENCLSRSSICKWGGEFNFINALICYVCATTCYMTHSTTLRLARSVVWINAVFELAGNSISVPVVALIAKKVAKALSGL